MYLLASIYISSSDNMLGFNESASSQLESDTGWGTIKNKK